MTNNRAERATVVMLLLVGMCFVATSVIKEWEFWLPIMIAPMAIGAVVLHFLQGATESLRWILYLLLAGLMVFLYCVHGMSRTHITLVFLLYLFMFTLGDRVRFFTFILVEYVLVMGISIVLTIKDHPEDINTTYFLGWIVNSALIFLVFLFSRSMIKTKIGLKKEITIRDENQADAESDIEDFLSNISHELRTPINVISGMTTILMKDTDRDELNSVRMACVRLAHQVEDIQDYTEIKQDGLVLEEEKYMTVSLINDIVAGYHMMEKSPDLELVVDLDPSVPTIMKGDVKKVQKMVRHLLENALKFTTRGGVCLRFSQAPRDYGINFVIEVTDTGVGMTRKDLSQVTKGMYQANKERDRSTGGIGIGLPIVYGLAHKMGGFVTINTDIGKGTLVRISIPQIVIDPQPCLTVGDDYEGCIAYYIKPEKFVVPEVREFYRQMAASLARALRVDLYSVSEKAELERMLTELNIRHIFTGQEEYAEEKDFFEGLNKKGHKVIVSVDPGTEKNYNGQVIPVVKPLYAFPIVRFLNEKISMTDDMRDDRRMMLNSVRALIVDDEPMNLVVAEGLFKEYGMNTDTAKSGYEAMEKYAARDYDLIFMDHMMPGMDGVETTKRLKNRAIEQGKNPIVVALTANALSGVREMLLKEGFDGFIAKPIDIGEFERVMRNVLPDFMIHYEGGM